MSDLNVVYYGSCWPTNIGNSFVNLGAIYSIKAAIGNGGKVFHFGGMSSYLFSINKKPKNTLSVGQMLECDYIVIGGMAMCVDNFQTQEVVLRQFIKKGAKIIVAGGGASRYDDWEVEQVCRWMKRIPIHGFISRDKYSFEKYGDFASHSYDGIDSALFISDCIRPISLSLPEFNVMNFDKRSEPHIDHGTRLVIRTHHSCWPTQTKRNYFKYQNTLISDLPSDYLSLYAQVSTTYSDRVHACLPTLAYGNRAMLFGKNVPRIRMFDRIGASKILEKPVDIDIDKIKREKADQIQFLKRILI